MKEDVMSAKRAVSAGGLVLFIFLGMCSAAKAGDEAAVKEHIEQITEGTHTYEIKLGGTLDEFNTANYLETYGGSMRLESKFQPNKYLVIENTGDSDVVNPRIVINGRRNWFSADDILASVLKPGMTDADKAMALYCFLAGHEVQCHENDRRPGPEIPGDETHPSRNTFQERANPVKAVNCYYCGGCQYEATNLVILCRKAGLVARPVWMNALDKYGAHCVAEVWYDGAWHLLDPDQRMFFLDSDNTNVASYEGLHNNPSLCDRTQGAGFASTGVKSRASQYRDNYPPHVMAVESWLSTMEMTLRPGEKFIRRWDHIGKYRCGANSRNIKPSRPQGLLPYQLANGKIVYQPRLVDTELFQRGIVSELNIKSVGADAQSAKLQPEVVGWPGFVIYKVSSPYPVVGGLVSAEFFRKTEQERCYVYISVHNSDWIEVWSAKDRGTGKMAMSKALDDYLNPLPTPAIYEYYLKFEIQTEDVPENVSLTQIRIETDVQIAATSLPAFSVGENNVVYRDDTAGQRQVCITHAWAESAETVPPLPPAEPAAPADGSAVDLASLKELAWKAAKDPDGSVVDYHIQVSPRPDMLGPISPNFDRIISSPQPQWQLPQGWFVKGRTYYWRLRARDNWGAWSDWSKVWKFKIAE